MKILKKIWYWISEFKLNNKKVIKKSITLKVSDYTKYPGPAFISLGKYSGEEYRETIFLPALKRSIYFDETLIVDLSKTVGYGPSFLKEAFKFDKICSKEQFIKTASFIDANRQWYVNDIKQYLDL